MRTAVISDLHLGSAARSDLLRSPAIRALLLEAIGGAERVVLLGDVLELRHGPARTALLAATPLFNELGAALPGKEVVYCPGNHDHALLAPWFARRAEATRGAPLSLEQRIDPAEASWALAELAEALAPASLSVAYPGLWLRPDVYATHGHHLDCHVTIPTLERLGIGAMSRVLGRPAGSLHAVDDYEAVSGPLFAWIDAVARQGPTNPALNGSITVRAWHALGGGDSTHSAAGAGGRPSGPGSRRTPGAGPAPGRRPRFRARLPVAPGRVRPAVARQLVKRAFPLVVAAVNRAGMGPLKPDISGPELRRAGLLAMGEVASRLGLDNAYVIFGHTHRAGPLAGDERTEWRGRSGARLVNTGCWTYERAFLRGAAPERSPYWPGGCVLVEGTEPPRPLRVLADRSREELLAALAEVDRVAAATG